MRNHKRILTLILLCLTTVLPLMAEDVSVNAEANRNQIYLGESFILQINVSGASAAEPDLSQIKNAKVRSLGKQNISNYSISFVNGQMTRQGFSGVVASYEITPLAAGSFQAGPVVVKVDGKTYSATGPAITITDIEKQDLVKLSITSSCETVLIDESFDVTLIVRIKRLPGQFAEIEPLFPDNPPVMTIPWLAIQGVAGLNGPDMEQLLNSLLIQNNRPGFAVNDYSRQADPFDFSSFMSGGRRRALFGFNHRRIRLNGNDYEEYFLTLAYTSKDEGNFVFGPAVFKGSVPVEPDSLGHASGVAIFAVGPACTVRVIPPPEQDRPACFTGGIGSNLTATASLDTSAASVGDPLKLTLELTGRARFDKMLPPKLNLQTNLLTNFTVYDNTVETVRQADRCRYIYTLRPKQAGAYQVPPIEVAYYDVKNRAYKTIASQPISISVKKGSEVTASQIVGNTNRLQTAIKTDDERTKSTAPIRTDAIGADSVALLGSPIWLVVAGAGSCLFLIGLTIRFHQEHSEQRKADRRRRQALPRALRSLNTGIKASALNLSITANKAIADNLCAAIRQYIAERLDIAASGLTPQDSLRLLTEAGAPHEATGEIARIFEHYFNAGFSIQPGHTNLGADCRKVKQLIHEIDAGLRSRDKKCRRVSAAFLFISTSGSLALFFCAPASALDASERNFVWNEANALMQSAHTPQDCLRAAQTYQKLVAAGIRNGSLFYNLGTALLQAGQIDPAIEAFQRAEQFDGAQSDIRRNLKIAMARKADSETAEWPWHRLVLFWHFYFSAAARMTVAASAFFIFWTMLTLRLVGNSRRWVTLLIILAFITVILFGSSVAASWHRETTMPNTLLIGASLGNK